MYAFVANGKYILHMVQRLRQQRAEVAMHRQVKMGIVVLHRTKELVHADVPVAPLFWLPPIY